MATTGSEPVRTGLEEFYGYVIQSGLCEHLEEATASFKRISEAIDNDTLDCGFVHLVDCAHLACGDSRIRCTPSGCFNELYWDWESSDSEAHLAAIAKFEIWEQWLREHNALPEDYKRPRLSHFGRHIPGSLLGADTGAVLSAFDGGNPSWCHGVCSQRGVTLGSCEKCIYSYAHNRPDQSNTETVAAFAGYARALGFETHRSVEHTAETYTEPYAEFRGCMIPQGLTPSDEVVENFMKVYDTLTAEDCSIDGAHTLAHCDELRCDNIECDHCLNYGFFGNCETQEKQLESIVRFQRWEDWLLEAEKLPGGYRPPVLHYRGFDIPNSLFSALRTAEISHSRNCLDEFNRGNDCWCRFVSCQDSRAMNCAGCIYCSNYGDHQQKVQAFAEYAQACGYTTNRQPQQRSETSTEGTLAEIAPRSCVSYTAAKQFQNSIVGFHLIESPLSIGTDKVVGDDDLLPKDIVVPANVTREKKAWQKALEHFNEGYSCWCEGLECPRDIYDCKGCLFSDTNPDAEKQFTELMGKLGWEVTRAKGDDYRINEVVSDDRSVDYSMSTESFDDPYRLPKLQINDIVQLDSPVSINGHSRTTCLWVMGPAIMMFDHQLVPGEYNCLAVDFESEGEGVRLGYIYRMSGSDGIHDPEAFVVSCKHIRKVYRFYRDGGFPHINGNNIRWNLNGTSSSCANVWTAGE